MRMEVPLVALDLDHISIMPTSVSTDPTPQKTPQTTTIGNYQTDRNGRRFHTNKALQPPYRRIKTSFKVLSINRFRVQVPATRRRAAYFLRGTFRTGSLVRVSPSGLAS